jgi:hypothetical protein
MQLAGNEGRIGILGLSADQFVANGQYADFHINKSPE